jgi:hypothetical protein
MNANDFRPTLESLEGRDLPSAVWFRPPDLPSLLAKYARQLDTPVFTRVDLGKLTPIPNGFVRINPTFHWKTVPGAKSYDVRFYDEDKLIFAGNIKGTSFKPKLDTGHLYSIEVRARGIFMVGEFSQKLYFLPPGPILR